ncbi:hypothetical protein [Aeromonas salmonicida]|uniref:hypothetical protein n=1 Tax=Aeromonas salmonicida TaxID=645 RepID=UPI00037BEA6E|nr:hypothetical protein [Aeromonas salmonicida]
MAAAFGGGSGGSNHTTGASQAGGQAGVGGVTTPVIPKKSEKASDIYAGVTREQYQDWKTRFYPKQKELMELATNGQLLRDQLGRVDQNNQHALAAARQATDNRMARMGVSTSHSVNDNSQGLRMALMTAGTENGLREQEQARQLGILTGADAGLREAINTSRGM